MKGKANNRVHNSRRVGTKYNRQSKRSSRCKSTNRSIRSRKEAARSHPHSLNKMTRTSIGWKFMLRTTIRLASSRCRRGPLSGKMRRCTTSTGEGPTDSCYNLTTSSCPKTSTTPSPSDYTQTRRSASSLIRPRSWFTWAPRSLIPKSNCPKDSVDRSAWRDRE